MPQQWGKFYTLENNKVSFLNTQKKYFLSIFTFSPFVNLLTLVQNKSNNMMYRKTYILAHELYNAIIESERDSQVGNITIIFTRVFAKSISLSANN